MKQPAMDLPQFSRIKQRSATWLRRLEIVSLMTLAVESANRNLSDVFVPKLRNYRPASWWTENDDLCLIYKIWKWGFAQYRKVRVDDDISFTCQSLPRPERLLARIGRLADGIREFYFDAVNRDRFAMPWQPYEREKVVRELLYGGVPLSPDGSHDCGQFRENCALSNRTIEELKRFAKQLMEIGDDEHPDLNHDNDDNSDSDDDPEGRTTVKPVRSSRLRLRYERLTQLRRTFLRFSEEEMKEHFSFLPRWRCMPRGWTSQMEFFFFREICRQGCGTNNTRILKMPEFEGLFEPIVPLNIDSTSNCLHRAKYALDFMEQHPLETLGKRATGQTKKMTYNAAVSVIPIPEIAYDCNGAPELPIHATPLTYVSDLGHIVIDRPGFHTDRSIYPAGFTSSRPYFSVLNPAEKARYTCEILDTGGEMPLFRVTMLNHPELCSDGNIPSIPWIKVGRKVLEMRGDANGRLGISGPDYFGLLTPVICYLIQQMEGADKCANYVMKRFEATPPQPKPKENEKGKKGGVSYSDSQDPAR
jgi:chromodomain-helicase-DNA-binding protein 7